VLPKAKRQPAFKADKLFKMPKPPRPKKGKSF
jgi:hypothetical protein